MDNLGLYVLRDDSVRALIDTLDRGDLLVAKSGFGLLEKSCLRWFDQEGAFLGSILSKASKSANRFSQSRQDFIMDRCPCFSISSLRIGRNLARFKSPRQFLRRTEALRPDFPAQKNSCPAHFPVPCNGITWFAFPALSMMVIAEYIGPCQAGANSTVSLHFFFAISCAGQFVAPGGNPNTCGLVCGTVAIVGFPKVIGGPFLAGLLSVSVTLLTFPTFTLPKFSADGVTSSDSRTPVGVGVGVGVAVEVGVAVGVGVPVPVPNAITRL